MRYAVTVTRSRQERAVIVVEANSQTEAEGLAFKASRLPQDWQITGNRTVEINNVQPSPHRLAG